MRGIKHKTCGKTSWNPNDLEQKYCGLCHLFLDDGDFEIIEGESRNDRKAPADERPES